MNNIKLINGTTLSQNNMPNLANGNSVQLNGQLNNIRTKIGLNEDILSKHSLFIGGT